VLIVEPFTRWLKGQGKALEGSVCCTKEGRMIPLLEQRSVGQEEAEGWTPVEAACPGIINKQM
jgi:hypothetical protein